MEVWKIIFLSKWVICRFHVNLPGCKHHQPFWEPLLMKLPLMNKVLPALVHVVPTHQLQMSNHFHWCWFFSIHQCTVKRLMVTGKTMHPLPQNVEKKMPHVWSICRKGAARQVCTTKHLAPTDPLLFQGGVDVCCPTCLVAYHALPGSVSWSTSLNLKYHSCHNLRPCICQQRRCNILSWPLQLVVKTWDDWVGGGFKEFHDEEVVF